MLKYYLEQNKKHGYYQKLTKEINQLGLGLFAIIPDENDFKTRYAAYEYINFLQTNNTDERLLNDYIISNKKIACEYCGQNVREIYISNHQNSYCEYALSKD
jgi:hypothetical protein